MPRSEPATSNAQRVRVEECTKIAAETGGSVTLTEDVKEACTAHEDQLQTLQSLWEVLLYSEQVCKS